MRRLARILRGRRRHDLGMVVPLVGHPNDACRYTLVWSLKNWNRLECLKDLSTKRFTGVQNISANILEKERSRPRPRPLQALVPDWSHEIEPTSGDFVPVGLSLRSRAGPGQCFQNLGSIPRLDRDQRYPGAEQDLEIILLHGASAYQNRNSN